MSNKEVKARILKFMDSLSMTVKKSGESQIIAEYRMGPSKKYLDEGEIEIEGAKGKGKLTKTGILKLNMIPAAVSETLVNVEFTGTFTLEITDSSDRQKIYTGKCESTGSLEREILFYIAR